MANMEVHFLCEACQEPLECEQAVLTKTIFPEPIFIVKPCKTCMERAVEEQVRMEDHE